MDRRAFLKSAGGAVTSQPAGSQVPRFRNARRPGHCASCRRLISPISDPIWSTAYIARHAAVPVWDTLYGIDNKLQPHAGWSKPRTSSAGLT